MLTLTAPANVLDPLQRHREPGAAVGLVLYSIRARGLVRPDTSCGPGRWTARWLRCPEDPQCTVTLSDADLATALDPDVLTDSGCPSPATHLVAYRAAWRSEVWQTLFGKAGALADQLASDAGPDLLVDLNAEQARRYALRSRMLPVGFEMTLTRLHAAALLRPVTDEDGARCGLVLALPPVWIAAPV